MAPVAQWHRLGVRRRVTLTFGLLALALSALLATLCWVVVSRSLLDGRATSALRETSVDADALSVAVTREQAQLPQLLDGLADPHVTSSVLDLRGRWYATSPSLGPAELPAPLVAAVRNGGVARQWFDVAGTPYLAVGTPLSQSGDLYFEVFDGSDVDHTLHVLSGALVLAAATTALLGLVVGRTASRLALRPLGRLTSVAGAVAGGDLSARLPDDGDPDLREIAQGFNRTASALEQRVIGDARFAGDVSHELRTPLTTMLNSMELVRNREQELPHAVREPLSLLAEEVQRFRTLVLDTLEIARHDAGEAIEREPAVLGDLVRAAADHATGRAVTVVDPAVAACVVALDKRRFEQVVVNLVRNADVHGRGCTLVHVTGTPAELRIEVDDEGPGVPPALRARIFERFYRSGQDAGGVGLGLAIVQRHVRGQGGDVVVQERPGGGARFVVRLPGTGG
ncbi:HAMP domain-containing sensor histidine kinase [Angustibacter sp. McL0619]|uniref:sensor histidine kinase n=1 Tax=Angustibacter sp. McL0619 TaxID=3415676 RepID=UPI003CE90E96